MRTSYSIYENFPDHCFKIKTNYIYKNKKNNSQNHRSTNPEKEQN